MNGFDLLRLAAALLVIVHHSYLLNGDGSPPLGFIDMGALAVGTFFVISGYLVTGSFLRSSGVLAYMAKRCLRIFPGLLVALLLTAFVLGPAVSDLEVGRYFASPQPALYVLHNLLLYPVDYLLPGVFDRNPYPQAVNGSLWTLRLEFTAYLGVAALGATKLLRLPVVLGLVALAGAGYVVAATLPGFGSEDELFRQPGLATQNGFLFLAGAALCLWGRRPPLWALALSVLLLATPVWGLGLPVVVLALGDMRVPHLPADLSYGLYIYAFPIQQWLASIGALHLVTALAMTLPFAALSWWLVEKPALRFKPGRAGLSG